MRLDQSLDIRRVRHNMFATSFPSSSRLLREERAGNKVREEEEEKRNMEK